MYDPIGSRLHLAEACAQRRRLNDRVPPDGKPPMRRAGGVVSWIRRVVYPRSAAKPLEFRASNVILALSAVMFSLLVVSWLIDEIAAL